MTNKQLLAQLRRKIAKLDKQEPGFGSFAEAAYEGAVRGLYDRLTAGRARWKYFDADWPRPPAAWAANGGISVTRIRGEVVLWTRDVEELLAEGADLALERAQIRPLDWEPLLSQAELTPRQIPLALAKSERRRDILDEILQVLEWMKLEAPDTSVEHVCVRHGRETGNYVGDWLKKLPTLLRGIELREEVL